eukprot:451572-Pelagomonas_calceolata.AAC.2
MDNDPDGGGGRQAGKHKQHSGCQAIPLRKAQMRATGQGSVERLSWSHIQTHPTLCSLCPAHSKLCQFASILSDHMHTRSAWKSILMLGTLPKKTGSCVATDAAAYLRFPCTCLSHGHVLTSGNVELGCVGIGQGGSHAYYPTHAVLEVGPLFVLKETCLEKAQSKVARQKGLSLHIDDFHCLHWHPWGGWRTLLLAQDQCPSLAHPAAMKEVSMGSESRDSCAQA